MAKRKQHRSKTISEGDFDIFKEVVCTQMSLFQQTFEDPG